MYSLKVHIPFAYFSEVIQDIPKFLTDSSSACPSAFTSKNVNPQKCTVKRTNNYVSENTVMLNEYSS